MTKKEFYEKVRDTYFTEASCTLEEFKKMLTGAMHVFGELETEVEEKEDETVIRFIDRDEADLTFAPEECELTKEDLNMSCEIMTLYLDKDGTIKLLENNIGLFTEANKETVLFLGSLIGKQIEL